MIDIENLEKDLNNKDNSLKSIYLLFGEEIYLLETLYKKIKNKFIKNISELINGINYVVIDEENLDKFMQEVETPSFGYEKKLIILKNSGILKKEGKKKDTNLNNLKDKVLSYFEKNKEEINDSLVIVIIESEIDDKHKLYKYINENYEVCKFMFQKPYELEKRIKQITNAYKVNIDSNSIKYFIDSCRN